jgi:hypothetical protein
MRQIGVGIAVTHAGAMGNLVEAIARPDRPDLHRLEENVVPSVAHRPSRIKTSRRRAENLTGGELAVSVCGADASRSSGYRVDRRFGRRNAPLPFFARSARGELRAELCRFLPFELSLVCGSHA